MLNKDFILCGGGVPFFSSPSAPSAPAPVAPPVAAPAPVAAPVVDNKAANKAKDLRRRGAGGPTLLGDTTTGTLGG